MTGEPLTRDLGAEREIEIDLRRWLNAFLARWWVAAAGLVIGLVIGTLYSLSGGGTSWIAIATIARGQEFSPSGANTVQGYLTSPAQIQNLIAAPVNVDKVAAEIGVNPNDLVGHVQASTITSAGTPSPTNTGSILVLIQVTLDKPKKAEDAANAFAALIKQQTTTRYVDQSIKGYQVRLANYAARAVALRREIASLNKVLANPSGLTPLDQLVLSSQLEGAQAALGQTLDSQTLTQQQLILAQDVETTQVVPPAAKATKTVVRSRRSSIVVAAVIGLIIGAILALILGLRATRRAAVS